MRTSRFRNWWREHVWWMCCGADWYCVLDSLTLHKVSRICDAHDARICS